MLLGKRNLGPRFRGGDSLLDLQIKKRTDRSARFSLTASACYLPYVELLGLLVVSEELPLGLAELDEPELVPPLAPCSFF